jgi:hypothetical protein
MNLTLNILYTEDKTSEHQMTFYKIDAISPCLWDKGYSTIYIGASEFVCTMPYDQLWQKIRDHEGNTGK